MTAVPLPGRRAVLGGDTNEEDRPSQAPTREPGGYLDLNPQAQEIER